MAEEGQTKPAYSLARMAECIMKGRYLPRLELPPRGRSGSRDVTAIAAEVNLIPKPGRAITILGRRIRVIGLRRNFATREQTL